MWEEAIGGKECVENVSSKVEFLSQPELPIPY